MSVWVFLAIFAFTFAMDSFYVRYLRAVAEGRAAVAATFSVLTHLSVVTNVGAVLHDRRYLAAVVLGAWCGTFLTTRRSSKETP